MHARIVVLNRDALFLRAAVRALTGAGYDVTGFSNPTIALNAMEAPPAADLLVTGGDFKGRQPHGIIVALRARHRFENIKILFTLNSDHAAAVRDIGRIVPAAVGMPDLLTAVEQMLSPRRQLQLPSKDRSEGASKDHSEGASKDRSEGASKDHREGASEDHREGASNHRERAPVTTYEFRWMDGAKRMFDLEADQAAFRYAQGITIRGQYVEIWRNGSLLARLSGSRTVLDRGAYELDSEAEPGTPED